MPEFDLGISRDPENLYAEVKGEGPRKTYPSTYITSKAPIEFGESGTAEIKYKVVERSERNRDGQEEYRYEIELHGITPMDSEDLDEETSIEKRKPKGSFGQNFGEMLDKARKTRDSDDE